MVAHMGGGDDSQQPSDEGWSIEIAPRRRANLIWVRDVDRRMARGWLRLRHEVLCLNEDDERVGSRWMAQR